MLNGVRKKILENSTNQADVRNDEEQSIKLHQILELLISAGYYRARIKGLADFDKIVGGMTWCIESCQFDVDVDLLFQENLIIGQKIALTEKIVIMLPKMNCPHRIEPHQIQGLDCIHIHPVMKWLVSESMKTRKQMARYLHMFAAHQFDKNNFHFNKHCSRNSDQNKFHLLRSIKFSQNRACCNLEKAEGVKHLNITKVQGSKSITFTSSNENLVPSDVQTSTILGKQKQVLQCKVDSLVGGKNELNFKLAEVTQRLNTTREKKASLENAYKKMRKSAAIEDKNVLVNLRELLMVHDHLKIQENQFKDQCHADLNYFNEIIMQLQTKKPQEDINYDIKYQKQKEIIHQLKLNLAKRNRAIACLMRQIDDVPGRSELTQYQKRFMELYNQVSAKHQETKQYYTLYNTLDDTKLYYTKELSLLNSVHDNYNEAMASSSSRDQFIKQFELIVDGIRRNKAKLEKRRLDEMVKRDALSCQLVTLMEQQRKYVAAVRQLTVECRNNEMMLIQLKGL